MKYSLRGSAEKSDAGQSRVDRIIARLCISGYRSSRHIRLDLDALAVVTWANGSGNGGFFVLRG
jgi:hypothetical protein